MTWFSVAGRVIVVVTPLLQESCAKTDSIVGSHNATTNARRRMKQLKRRVGQDIGRVLLKQQKGRTVKE